MAKHTLSELRQWQALPLNIKVLMTKDRIRQWINEYGEDGVYVSFSGGKDSTVLLHIVREMYPNVKAVFVDTGLEFPEIRNFVKTYENVEWLRPRMNFRQVIDKYGYPIISKDVSQAIFDVNTQAKRNGCDKRETNLWNRWFNPESDYIKKFPAYSRERWDFLNDAPFDISHRCCNEIKKNPSIEHEKKTGLKPIIATMASESRLRTTKWIQYGCNAFDVERPISKPMSFWTEQDVLLYIKQNNLPICSVYGDIVEDLEGTDEVEGQLTISDLEGYEDVVEFDAESLPLKTTGRSRTGCVFCLYGIQVEKSPNRLEMLKETHPQLYDYVMRPKSEGGLGYKEKIDWINEHGNMNIRY